jgi:ribonucleoside-diphosphate reductase alpha chain
VDDIIEQVSATGTLRDVPGGGDALRRLFVTALDIAPERHLAVQAAFQHHVDNSVSKTVNLPASASVDDVTHVYRRAWELGPQGRHDLPLRQQADAGVSARIG